MRCVCYPVARHFQSAGQLLQVISQVILGKSGKSASMITMRESARSFAQEGKFSLDDIPEIKNKKALTLIIETGDAHSKTIPAIEEFSKKTSVKVESDKNNSAPIFI